MDALLESMTHAEFSEHFAAEILDIEDRDKEAERAVSGIRCDINNLAALTQNLNMDLTRSRPIPYSKPIDFIYSSGKKRRAACKIEKRMTPQTEEKLMQARYGIK